MGAIGVALRLNQPQVSKHLRVLKAAQLVEVEQRAQQRLYRLRATPLRELNAWLERYREIWDERLDQLDQLIEELTTKPEYVKRWWAPQSRGVTLVECEAEVRIGGAYRYVIGRGETERYVFSGKYLEIARPTRLVYTQIFEAFPGMEAVVTVGFEERDGSTQLVSHELYPTVLRHGRRHARDLRAARRARGVAALIMRSGL